MCKLKDDIKLFCADNPSADSAELEKALSDTNAFDLSLLGIEGEFSVHNESLVDFILNSKYETISVHLAHILRKTGVRRFAKTYYQPAQDYLAELRSKNSHEPLAVPRLNELPRREYCETIIDALLAIDAHIAEGKKMDLHTEVIYLHDEIFGMFMDRFDADVLKAAHELFAIMNVNYNLRVEDYNENLPIEKQSQGFYESAQAAISYFYSEVDYVRRDFLNEDWLKEDSLPFLYLLAHVERRIIGIWFDE